MTQKYFEPDFKKDSFTCPHCGVFAKQNWNKLSDGYQDFLKENFYNCCCEKCLQYSIWLKEKMIYPLATNLPEPNDDLKENIKQIYNEARNIYRESPRASCVLLRLAIQELCVQLGEKGGNLNEAIANLVKKGLSPLVQKSLDFVRVVGNNAVHTGKIQIEDSLEIASSLFHLINFISEKMITEPIQLENLYNSLPQDKLKEIENRDNKS